MKRYHIIFKGRVQGVGFRFQVKMLADRIGLTGSVRNLYENGICRVKCVRSVVNREVRLTDERIGHRKSDHEVP